MYQELFSWIPIYVDTYLYFTKKRNSVKEGRRNTDQGPIGLPRVSTPRSSVISCGAGSRTLVHHAQTEPGLWDSRPLLCTLHCYVGNSN